jgi:hypothetical protein
VIVLCCALLAGCGSDDGGTPGPEIGKAKTFELVGLGDAGALQAGKPATLRMHIEQPEGGALTTYKTGDGPHTGVHLIMVNDDLTQIVHRHPPVGSDGTFEQEVTFPSGGTWRVVADAYPDLGPNTLQNFQLTGDLDVAGKEAGAGTPGFEATQRVDGDTFTMSSPKSLRALKPSYVQVDVRDANGRPAKFSEYYGALAHAIFFREGDLTYFHTHVCGQGATACTSSAGGSSVTGTTDRPGKLRVGMLLPSAGTWRLFLQAKVNGKVTTVTYTLKVRG